MTDHNAPAVPAVIPEPGAILAPPPPTDIHSLLAVAVDRGIAPAAVEKLVNLYERMADRAAREQFAQAFARFQAAVPPIGKDKVATIARRDGGEYSYAYADLDTITRAIAPALRDAGLSYSWDSTLAANQMTVTCTLRHVGGHAVTASFTCPTDSSNPGMSPQQKAASALTFARRQALVAVCGLSTCDADTDGAEPAGVGAYERVSADQVTQIEGWLSETGDADGWRPRMLAAYRVPTVADLPASKFDEVVAKLRAKTGVPA